MHTPRVSIGLPVYNGERFLVAGVESLLNQTYEDFELILSDNGSTDGTESICRKYAAQDSRVRYYRIGDNRGSIWNFNRAFELATGQYFKWAADDDIHAPTFLAKAVAVLDSSPEVLWCFCRHSLIGPDDKGFTDPRVQDASLLDESGRDRSSQRVPQRFLSILLKASGVDSYGLIRRQALAKTRLYQPCYGWEKVLLGELAMQGRYAEIPETLFYLRVHPDASSSLTTEAELQRFVDPSRQRRLSFLRLRLLRAHLATVGRFPLSMSDRIRCYAALGRYLLQAGKWGSIAKAALSGNSIGGGYSSLLGQLEQQPIGRTHEAEEPAKRETIVS